MATRKVTGATSDTPAESSVEKLLSALGTDDTLYLNGWDPKHGRGYLGRFTVDGAEEPHEILERIRAEHGPGRYYLQKKSGNDWGEAATFNILPRPGESRAAAPEPDRVDKLAEIVERLAERLDRPASGVADLGKHAAELASGLMSAQMPLITALAESSSRDSDRMIETLLRGMELGRDNQGGADSGDRFTQMLGAVMARMEAQSPNGAAATAVPPPPPGPAWLAAAQPYAGALASAVGKDPAMVAQALADLLPDPLLDAIAEDAAAPQRLATLHPSLSDPAALAWLQALWTELVNPGDDDQDAELEPDPAPEPASSEATG
jgi:hypothetical protein